MEAGRETASRVQRVRHELKRRDVEVVKVAPLGAHFVAVTFHGEDLADFVSASFDDHVKFIFDDASGEQVRRDYTPRRYDPTARELTIEFALHGDGKASAWARQAAAGQRVTIGGPRGSMIVPADYGWHLLAGDATALPAIRRRLEELPAGVRATVVIACDDAVTLASAARLDVRQVADGAALVDAIRAMPLPGEDAFVWFGGEASVAAQVRDVVHGEKGFPRSASRISAYWKQGASDHHEDL
ncbi:siderophore-interacting protein [Pseudoduganella umbonata]|uniref:NADPH-dependent ferric siderophore reductase n=1 Tax=Pseudoduganella umbonata TaxID=864828 RepID=A0A4P8HXA0_9BURK|nr:siderophore-interacting protein [Pseudoduganella umbonata]MBB3222956.1 NADPH-dependent ferric siderophore reductase [Pseudoduganella umbonata]QCP13075.1 siderophore-interacting protein [Pseudoduganella umbonata]